MRAALRHLAMKTDKEKLLKVTRPTLASNDSTPGAPVCPQVRGCNVAPATFSRWLNLDVKQLEMLRPSLNVLEITSGNTSQPPTMMRA